MSDVEAGAPVFGPALGAVLDPREVARRALEQHRLTVRRVVRAAASSNTVFRVETYEGSYCLRIPAAVPIHAPGSLQAGGAWLERLHRRGVPAPVPVQTCRTAPAPRS